MEEGIRQEALGISEKEKGEEKAVSPSLIPKAQSPMPEQGGPKGPDPTRYGDWEINGKCVDF